MNTDLYKDETTKVLKDLLVDDYLFLSIKHSQDVIHTSYFLPTGQPVWILVTETDGVCHSLDDAQAFIEWYGPNMWTAIWFRKGKKHRSRKNKFSQPAVIINRFNGERGCEYWQHGTRAKSIKRDPAVVH